jgi:hypothetical protein
MKKTVFYSWQSDLPNGTNRSLIENSLNDVAKEIVNDSETDIEPVIDRDTQGVAGAPNIATAIFKKIDSADIFVADVSIIGNAKKKAVPNPNVLIELGYALKALGHERIILVFNTAFGKVEKLPFDLRMHRTLTYHCPESMTDRSEVKKNLTKSLKSALLTGFSRVSAVTQTKTATPILDIIKNNSPSKKIELRNYLAEVPTRIEEVQPLMKRDGGDVQDLLSAIPKTEDISLDFAKLSEVVVLMDDVDSAKEIFQWFGKLITKYYPILSNGSGQSWNCDGDFYKFVGHELFVSFISPFLKENKFDELKEILKGTLLVGPTQHFQNEQKQPWGWLSGWSPLIDDEGRTRRRLSLHGDLLKDRHEKDTFKSILPFKEFTEADFFLHLFGQGKTEDRYRSEWYPRSDIWLKNTPRFILEAIDYPTAMKICNVLQISDVEELKRRLRGLQIRFDWHSPISEDDIKKIGSQGGAKIIS